MGKTQDKIQIIKSIKKAALQYKKYMVGKSFLYIFEGKSIEVVYRKKDFLHLTGVDTNLSANDFYKEAVRGTLTHQQIYFSNRHPYDLCVRKMAHLENIVLVTNSPLFMLEDIKTDTFRFKFGVSELNFSICLDFVTDDSGIVLSDKYIARSLRDEDIFSRSGNAYEVQCILSKPNDSRLYSTTAYMDDQFCFQSLSKNIIAKIDPSLLKTYNFELI